MTVSHLSENDLNDIRKSLPARLDSLRGSKVLIVGDVGLDEYVLGDVQRISPEAPVPVLDVRSEDSRLGLAANVAQNVASLGGEPILLAVVGEDSTRGQFEGLLKEAGVDPKYLVADASRPTTRKLRVMAEHHHIVRVDYEKKKFLSQQVEDKLLSDFDQHVQMADGVVLEDYAKGVLSERVCRHIINGCHKLGKKVFVDPHPSTPMTYYAGADVMTPNREEALKLSRLNTDDLHWSEDTIYEVGEKLKSELGSENMIITLGKEGMLLFESKGARKLPTYARQVFDVAGAGDTVIAALTLAWSSGWTPVDSCILANFAAGVVVSKVGCVPCPVGELKTYIESHEI
ncbi:MAG: D-glycero-beta-D-manno-heptose-7-phosphate kinase [Pseudomonadota bacterium]